MFRLFIAILIISFLCVIGYVIYQLIRNNIKKSLDVDTEVNLFKNKLHQGEIISKSGVLESESNLKKHKENLKKVNSIKNKIK